MGRAAAVLDGGRLASSGQPGAASEPCPRCCVEEETWSYEGHRVVEHDGVVNGFQSEILRLPEDRLLVVILSNNLDHRPSPPMLAIERSSQRIGTGRHRKWLSHHSKQGASRRGWNWPRFRTARSTSPISCSFARETRAQV